MSLSAPHPVTASDEPPPPFPSFCKSNGLDVRLQKALSKSAFTHPTLVQASLIPLILSGRDVLCKARTGSGKTLGYVVPVIEKVVRAKKAKKEGSAAAAAAVASSKSSKGSASNNNNNTTSTGGPQVIVLVPTRELVAQVYSVVNSLLYYFEDEVSVMKVDPQLSDSDKSSKNQSSSSSSSKTSSSSASSASASSNSSSSSTTTSSDLASDRVLVAALRDDPDILITTPTLLLQLLTATPSSPTPLLTLTSSLHTLILDEADLLLTYGYLGSMRSLLKSRSLLPAHVQTVLVSATFSDDIKALKSLALHAPAILKVKDGDGDGKNDGNNLKQFYLPTPKGDRFLLLYCLLKLGLLPKPSNGSAPRRTLIFCNSVSTSYRVKLLLEQFGIKSTAVNSSMPFRCRVDAVEAFNAGTANRGGNGGVGDIVIATDDAVDGGDKKDKKDKKKKTTKKTSSAASKKNGENSGKNAVESDEEEDMKDEEESSAEEDDSDDSSDSDSDAESAVETNNNNNLHRGIDFKDIDVVVNFDFPKTSTSYVHRVGRTARAGKKGTALSFLCLDDGYEGEAASRGGSAAASDKAAAPNSKSSAGKDGCLWASRQAALLSKLQGMLPALPSANSSDKLGAAAGLGDANKASGIIPQPALLDFDANELSGFRYRVADVSRAVTQNSIDERMAEEVRREIINSDRLQSHFEENPRDLQLLEHGGGKVGAVKVQGHLKHLASYLIPKGMVGVDVAGIGKFAGKRRKRAGHGGVGHGGPAKDGSRNKANDPLMGGAVGDVSGGLLDGVGEQMEQRGEEDGEGGGGGGGVTKGKKRKGDPESEGRVFTDQADGTGRSTSGRRAWQEAHGKGKFSKRYKSDASQQGNQTNNKYAARKKIRSMR